MKTLRVASCQFPVTHDIGRNASYIRRYLRKASDAGANLLHTSEACLSGYGGSDFSSFDSFDWERLRQETSRLRELVFELNLWLVLGSSHFLSGKTPPTNCLYLIDPKGKIVDRYDKCMCTTGDQRVYSAGNRLVVKTINGIRVGLAICYDVCYPQIYTAYRLKGVKLMLPTRGRLEAVGGQPSNHFSSSLVFTKRRTFTTRSRPLADSVLLPSTGYSRTTKATSDISSEASSPSDRTVHPD